MWIQLLLMHLPLLKMYKSRLHFTPHIAKNGTFISCNEVATNIESDTPISCSEVTTYIENDTHSCCEVATDIAY